MQILWRTLPSMALPAALGLGVAYLATGFVPPPAPNLRPPEQLRAVGQAYAEESPVRAILERNVLNLEAPVFAPLDQLSASESALVLAKADTTASGQGASGPGVSGPGTSGQGASGQAQAAFAPVEANLTAPGGSNSSVQTSQAGQTIQPGQASFGAPAIPAVSEALSGGHTVVGRIAPPAPGTGSGTSPTGGPVHSSPGGMTHSSTGAMAPSGHTTTLQQSTTTPQPAASAPRISPAGPAAQAAPSSQAVPAAPKAPAPAPVAPAPSLAGLRLVGVIAGGEKPLAMLNVDGQALSLKVGDTVRGWTLTAVEPGLVVLKSGEHVRRLALGAAAK